MALWLMKWCLLLFFYPTVEPMWWWTTQRWSLKSERPPMTTPGDHQDSWWVKFQGKDSTVLYNMSCWKAPRLFVNKIELQKDYLKASFDLRNYSKNSFRSLTLINLPFNHRNIFKVLVLWSLFLTTKVLRCPTYYSSSRNYWRGSLRYWT